MKHTSLVTALTRRLVVVGALLTLLNVAFVTAYYSWDMDDLRRQNVFRQIDRLAGALSRDTVGALRFGPSGRLIDDYRIYPEAYAYRILDHNGVVVSESNADLVPTVSWATAEGPDTWSSTIEHRGRTVLLGSRHLDIGGLPVRIAFASASDPSSLVLFVFFDELFVHVVVALLPFALCLVIVNVVTVRQSMRPLVQAAEAARHTGHAATITRLPTADLPREVLDLVDAINDALGRLETALEAERAFTAEAAHALRTPLSILAARVDEHLPSPVAQAVRDDVSSLKRLVEQMLSAAQADTLVLNPDQRCDLANVARSVVGDMAPIAIGLQRQLAYEGPATILVNGDTDAVAHALRNLIDNGLRFTPPGTEVIVRVTGDGTLAVHDFGPGFPAEDRKMAFKRFWRGSPSERGGTGLGLSIVKRIADAHGAAVHIEDAANGGTKVTISFKIADGLHDNNQLGSGPINLS
ncbi:Signal transduction histidine kinase [Bosea sp. LC85]|uniref:sensor histidine kinase n=1 Tax=Bosea sp. LC85 TaxID=1502851 RepID=UPI0004E35550|nr:HAMP domain-containing sensor histidine kinase [Bosea sp. LC85]KFC75428.1 Signal transduction histidine kinase [Bosea sp. LC85]